MADYAVGLPRKGNKGNLTDLPTNVVLRMIRQRHLADKAGPHTDVRFTGPAGLYSFAAPKDLPTTPGEKRLFIPTELHRPSYKDFEGVIPSGYGKGSVKKLEESPVIFLRVSPDHLVFTRGDQQDAPVYSLRRTKNGNYICAIKSKDQPTQVVSYKKDHFPSVPIEQVAELIEKGARVREKIDGASTLLYLGRHGIRAFGTRVGANGQRPEYTAHIGGLYDYKVPEELQDRLIRGELYGVHNGKPIHPNELAAILHMNLANAIETKQKRGIQLLVAALAENKGGKDDYWAGADDIVAKLKHPAIHGLSSVTGEDAKKLLKAIGEGKDPITREGVVITTPEGKSIKSKFKDDYDVVIRDIFKADTDRGDMAGGFTYSYPGSDKIVGRVGTGFDNAMRKDMWKNPANYIGALARVTSQEQLPSKALRAPSFVALRAD